MHFIHTEKSFWNCIKSNPNQIVFTIFPLIRNQTELFFVPNQSEKGIYNLIPVISTRMLNYLAKLKIFFDEMPLSANLREPVLNPKACGVQGCSPGGGCGGWSPPAHNFLFNFQNFFSLKSDEKKKLVSSIFEKVSNI